MMLMLWESVWENVLDVFFIREAVVGAWWMKPACFSSLSASSTPSCCSRIHPVKILIRARTSLRLLLNSASTVSTVIPTSVPRPSISKTILPLRYLDFNSSLLTFTSLVNQVVSVYDCGVRGPRFESHCWWLCLSWQLLWFTALGTSCTPLLQFLGRLSLPPSVGWLCEYQPAGWVVTRMAMMDVEGSCQFSADSQPKSFGLVWVLAATRRSVWFVSWTG